MSHAKLATLGPLLLSFDESPINRFRTNRVQALLAYLAVEASRGVQVQRREALIELLWPGMPTSSALQNLRQTLYELRKRLPAIDGTPFLINNRYTVQIHPDYPLQVDTKRFSDLLAHHPDHWLSAVDLYRGDFLANFQLPDAATFNLWVADRRADYRRQVLDALTGLTDMQIEHRNYDEAERLARRQLSIDPLRERAHRQLMTALASAGRRAAALQQFESVRHLLEKALAVPVSQETQRLAEAIRAEQLPAFGRTQTNLGGYDLKEMIGSGNFGSVYRAVHAGVGREVAIKIIRDKYANQPDFIRRFEAEAQLVARLEHPHIVPLYDFWREPGSAYLVMRWLRGGSLADRLNGGWSAERTLPLLQQIAQALHAAHQRGVIHRDIKPANILLDEAGNGYLSDFGIALAAGSVPTNSAEMPLSASFIAPEHLTNQPLTPRSDIYSLGVTLYTLLTGEAPFAAEPPVRRAYLHRTRPLPSLLDSRPTLPPALDTVIQTATAKTAAQRYATPLALAAAFHAAVTNGATTFGVPTGIRSGIDNPYKGLQPFGEADAGLFFGRERLIQRLAEQIAKGNFLALVGPSGSGKSSVVRSGLIPALRGGAVPGSEEWFITHMLPGTHPFEELENALLRVAVDGPDTLLTQLQDGDRGLVRAVKRVLPPGSGQQLLLVIDQFEELFTLVEDAERRRHFLRALHAAVSDDRTPIRVIVTLRADFYDRPLLIDGFSELMRRHTEVITPLNSAELTASIRRPAALTGVQVEPDLVSILVADFQRQTGALPLLQYTLTALFERRAGNTLTVAAYNQLGGILGALTGRAEEIYQAFDAQQQLLVKQLFLRLVTLGEGVEDTRRRVLQSELANLGFPATEDFGEATAAIPKPIAAIQAAFGAARLLSFDHDPVTREPTVEVAHEALLHEWPRLSRWLEESRADVRRQRMLGVAASDWRRAGQDPAYLLRGSRLKQFADWSTAATVALTDDERAFLDAGITAQAARRAAEESRRARELEQARQLAATERQRAEEQALSATRLRRRAWLLTAAMVVALMLTAAAFYLRTQAQRNFVRAERLRLAARAAAELAQGTDTVTSALLALHSLTYGYSTEADVALTGALRQGFAYNVLAGHRDVVAASAFANRSHWLLTGSNDQTARLWDTQNFRLIHELTAHSEVVTAVAFGPDDRWLATGSADRSVRLWDTASGTQIGLLPPHGETVWAIAVTPDGSKIATNDRTDAGEPVVRLWDRQTLAEIGRFRGHGDTVVAIAFAPDGTLAASGGLDNTARLWAVADQTPVLTIEGHADVVSSVEFSADAQTLLTASYDQTVRLWNRRGEEIQRFLGHVNAVNRASFFDGGRFVITTSEDGSTRIWNAQTGLEVRRFSGGIRGKTRLLSFDEQQVAVSTFDSTVQVWDMQARVEPLLLARPFRTLHTTDVIWGRFSAMGDSVLTANGDGTLVRWSTSDGALIDSSRFDSGNLVTAIDLSADERLAATGEGDGTIRIWDVASRQILQQWVGHAGVVWAVAFAPDGATVVTVGEDGGVHLWDSATGGRQRSFVGHTADVVEVAWSPDGSLLATAGFDRTARLWDVATGEALHVLGAHEAAVLAIAFAPDGRQLLTGGRDRTARLWDVATGEEVRAFVGHSAEIEAVAFSPVDPFIVTGSNDFTGRVWHRETGTVLRQFDQTETSIRLLAVSPDGSRVLTGDLRVAYLWRTHLHDVVALACAQLPRGFSAEEVRVFKLQIGRSPCEN